MPPQEPISMLVIIPTYNNATTIAAVLDSTLEYTRHILVVNDGSTDHTARELEKYQSQISIISYPVNKGKGYALKMGFQKAVQLGFQYALTMDSDGQHYASDILRFQQEAATYPTTLIVGSRQLKQENKSEGSTFANRFSNFWFHLQTGVSLPDTQSGYRLYPLHRMGNMAIWTNRYEAELELLVFSAWRGISFRALPISVYYAPAAEKVSHFRPFQDFTRISLLNTVLVFLAVLYGYPSMFVRKLFISRPTPINKPS